MPFFTYQAMTRSGQTNTGSVEAPDKKAALAAVTKMGLVPLSVKEEAGGAPKKKAASGESMWKLSARQNMKMREVLLFSEELSDLLAAGMTLGSALNSLASHSTDSGSPIARIAGDLRDRIIRGESFSDALEAHPKSFERLYVNMIRAGEASGALPEVLLRLVEHYERIMDMRERVISAMVYPCIVIVFGIGAMAITMTKIMPKFETVFQSINVGLPGPTRALMGISRFSTRYGVFIIIGAVLLGILFNRYINRPEGRLWWDGLKLKMPLIKGIIASSVFANFAYTLKTLLANGVHVLQALRITEETVGNSVIARELAHARERVTDGTTISGPLAAGKVFPAVMTDMMAIGEQTGDMPGALNHIGRRFEGELDRNIKILTTALEPILIVLVAGGVGFIAVSILLAVFKVTSGIGTG